MRKLPPQIVGGAKRPSFAFTTVTERWPKIVTSVVDNLHRYYIKSIDSISQAGGQLDTDVKSVISKLSKMRYRIMTGKPLELFRPDMPYASLWNDEIGNLNKENEKEITWFTGPWLFVECYMYRQIWDFFQQTKNLGNYDPFREDKEKGYKNSFKYLLAIGTELNHLLEKKLSKAEIHEALARLLQISLWGNKCDLSLTGGDPHSMSDTIFHELDDLKQFILANDLDCAIDDYLITGALKQVDMVLDNAGLELFMDLCLADFLISNQLAMKVILHGKEFPYFVSDTTKMDLEWIVEQLILDTDYHLNRLGNRWRNYINQNKFEFRAHSFWTQGFEYCRMIEKAPDLYEQLRASSLLIFKGDLNYRKLVSDREWPLHTPFSEALCGFEPAPLLALRTLKAETIVGLNQEAIQKISSKFISDDLSWMTSSDYAVIQLHVPVTRMLT